MSEHIKLQLKHRKNNNPQKQALLKASQWRWPELPGFSDHISFCCYIENLVTQSMSVILEEQKNTEKQSLKWIELKSSQGKAVQE